MQSYLSFLRRHRFIDSIVSPWGQTFPPPAQQKEDGRSMLELLRSSIRHFSCLPTRRNCKTNRVGRVSGLKWCQSDCGSVA